MVQNLLFFFIILFFIFVRFNNYFINLSYYIGVDIISYGLLCLRIWVCCLIIISSESIFKFKNFTNLFSFLVLFLLLILFLTFSSVNLFLFYIFFERSLIPTLFLILG